MSQPSRLIRDRIKELRCVKASLLVPNPKNWRIHGKQQAAALKGPLSELGYADALLARELPDGKLMLIDGHLRPKLRLRFWLLPINSAALVMASKLIRDTWL